MPSPPVQYNYQNVRRCPECGHAVKGEKPAKLCRTCENSFRASLKTALGVGIGYLVNAW